MTFKADKILILARNFEKTAQESSLAEDFRKTLFNYEHNSEAVKDFVEGLRSVAEQFNRDSKSYGDPKDTKIYSLMNKQAEIVARCIPEVAAIDAEIDKIAYQQPTESGVSSIQPEEEAGPETMRSRAYLRSFDKMINKFAQNPPEVSDAGPVTWNTKPQSDEDAKTFLQPGGEHKVPGAPGAAYRPDVALAQRKLNDMQMRGTINFGSMLVPDGLMGPKTQAGLNAYKTYIGVPSLTNDLAIQALSKKQDQTETANGFNPQLGF